ncbi:MAG: histidine kinase [Pirellulaceae bacterium]|nr:histidine kinase [Pirellulaceae bacterium]
MSEASGSVVFLSGDLMFASRVRGAAERAGWSFALTGKLPESSAVPIRFVVLDLATMSKLTEGITEHCAANCPDAKLIAYGPHVQVAKLDAARNAGIPVVMTRGQFDSKLSTLFAV